MTQTLCVSNATMAQNDQWFQKAPIGLKFDGKIKRRQSLMEKGGENAKFDGRGASKFDGESVLQ